MEDCPCREGGVLRFADTDIEAAVLIAEAPLYLDFFCLSAVFRLGISRRTVGHIAQEFSVSGIQPDARIAGEDAYPAMIVRGQALNGGVFSRMRRFLSYLIGICVKTGMTAR